MLAALTDIIERKKVEEVLVISERNLAASQKIAQVGSYSWYLEKNLLTWSDDLYRILGLTSMETSPTFDIYASFIHPDDKDDAIRKIKAVIEEGRSQINERRIIKSDGTVRFVQIKSKVLRETEGKPAVICGVVQDITERKLANEKLQ